MVEPHSSNFGMITANFLGVRIFRKFTVNKLFLPKKVPSVEQKFLVHKGFINRFPTFQEITHFMEVGWLEKKEIHGDVPVSDM